MDKLLSNVHEWTFKNRAEIEALDDATLSKVYKDLCDGIKLFHDHHVPITGEMFWQMMVIPREIIKRK